nr:MAG TPA: hypothetical protein [Caudoviricetes sp.]
MKIYVEKEKVPYKKVSEITGIEYLEDDKSLMLETMLTMINDLICEYHNMEEKYEDLQKDIKENYIQKECEGDEYEDYVLYQN